MSDDVRFLVLHPWHPVSYCHIGWPLYLSQFGSSRVRGWAVE